MSYSHLFIFLFKVSKNQVNSKNASVYDFFAGFVHCLQPISDFNRFYPINILLAVFNSQK